jgi:hypothetical protein
MKGCEKNRHKELGDDERFIPAVIMRGNFDGFNQFPLISTFLAAREIDLEVGSVTQENLTQRGEKR